MCIRDRRRLVLHRNVLFYNFRKMRKKLDKQIYRKGYVQDVGQAGRLLVLGWLMDWLIVFGLAGRLVCRVAG